MSTQNTAQVRAGFAALALGAAFGSALAPAQAQAQMMDSRAIQMALPADGAREVPTPDMKAVLDALKALKPKPLPKLTPSQARQQPGASAAAKEVLKARDIAFPEDIDSVTDKTLPTKPRPVLVRIYKPKGAGSGPLPVIVYFHGGGFVIAGISQYDSSCRAMANAAKALVVAVAYRMAPESPLPAAHEDSYAATQYVLNNAASMGGDPARVAVLGESAGGNLATDMCIMARDRGGKMPVHQALIYPYVDLTAKGLNAASMRENANAAPLNRAGVAWFNRWARNGKVAASNPLVSPLYNNVRGLPPATIVLAEIDPLRTQGAQYARKLMNAGVRTRVAYYTGVTHEFYGMGAIVPKAKQANTFVANQLKMAFNR